MNHRMYLRRCSMSSISEESETGDDEYLVRDERHAPPASFTVENCLGDLNSFKAEIREAYEELSTLERQAQDKTSTSIFNIEQDDLDILLEQLQTLEHRLDRRKMFHHGPTYHQQKKSISPNIIAQFDELDQALATLTSTLNNVEIELGDSGNSSSSSAASDSNTAHHHEPHEEIDDHRHEIEVDEHFSDSGLSQSTDSISLPFRQSSQLRTNSQISTMSSIPSCDTLRHMPGEHHIRLALEKMHEANIRKMFVKIHTADQSTKNILIDETMSIYDVIVLLLHKYHLQPTCHYSIVEDLPDLHLYRVLEDHQNLIHDAIAYWSRDTNNRICFQEHPHRYSMFTEPKKFFSNQHRAQEKRFDDTLIDYVSSNTIVLPDDITGCLYVKDKNRKVWKKCSCVLRQSGIYQIPKAASSSSSSFKRDLLCLIKFDVNIQLYHAKNWIDSLRSPTSFGFALKHAHIQKKSNKYIHYLCANTFDECQRWINGIRIIQYGIQLYKNHQRLKNVVENGPEHLARVQPNQHHFNFIQTNLSSNNSQVNSTISLPINHIVSDASSASAAKSFIDLERTPTKQNFNSLDRQKTSKISFTRSSSFHASLRRSNKAEQKLQRTYSTSPPHSAATPAGGHEISLKRSKSTKEIVSKAAQTKVTSTKDSTKPSGTSSIFPFINQCIQPGKSSPRSKVPQLPPKRPPPPLPKKITPPRSRTVPSMTDNHIYDSFQDSPPPAPASRLPPMRVTEL